MMHLENFAGACYFKCVYKCSVIYTRATVHLLPPPQCSLQPSTIPAAARRRVVWSTLMSCGIRSVTNATTLQSAQQANMDPWTQSFYSDLECIICMMHHGQWNYSQVSASAFLGLFAKKPAADL